jgi:hypothetical protein
MTWRHTGCGGKNPRILNLHTRRKWVLTITPPNTLPPRESPGYLLDRWGPGPMSTLWRRSLAAEFEPLSLGSPARSPVSVLPELTQLSDSINRQRSYFANSIYKCVRGHSFTVSMFILRQCGAISRIQQRPTFQCLFASFFTSFINP